MDEKCPWWDRRCSSLERKTTPGKAEALDIASGWTEQAHEVPGWTRAPSRPMDNLDLPEDDAGQGEALNWKKGGGQKKRKAKGNAQGKRMKEGPDWVNKPHDGLK